MQQQNFTAVVDSLVPGWKDVYGRPNQGTDEGHVAVFCGVAGVTPLTETTELGNQHQLVYLSPEDGMALSQSEQR